MQINLLILAEIITLIKFQHNRFTIKSVGSYWRMDFHTNDQAQDLPSEMGTPLDGCPEAQNICPLPTQDRPTSVTRWYRICHPPVVTDLYRGPSSIHHIN